MRAWLHVSSVLPLPASPRSFLGWGRRLIVAIPLALLLLVWFSGVASAHALLVRSDPTQNAILEQSPAEVRLWFDEKVIPALAKVAVVDQANHEYALGDTHIAPTDPLEVEASLPSLPGGTYVVFWQVVSADDSHPTGGFFVFRVRFSNGAIPALPAALPTGPTGLFNTSIGQCLTGPSPFLCAPTVLSDWLVLLAATFLVGGIFWQTVLIEQAAKRNQELVATAQATASRFRWGAKLALNLFLVANLGYVFGQVMLDAGRWDQGLSSTIWARLLLESPFGIFWLVRMLLGLSMLLLLVLTSPPRVSLQEWRLRPVLGWVQLGLGVFLLLSLAASGHAAAAQGRAGLGAVAIPGDWLHLLATSLWVGGLLFIAVALLPAIRKQASVRQAQVLVSLLPRFSLIAITGAIVAALSGSLNADVQLTSWSQFLDTSYGRTLIVKTLLFLLMVAISTYHVFRLRPALAQSLRAWKRSRDTDLPEETDTPERAVTTNGAGVQNKRPLWAVALHRQVVAAHRPSRAAPGGLIAPERATSQEAMPDDPPASAGQVGRSSEPLERAAEGGEGEALTAPVNDQPQKGDDAVALLVTRIESQCRSLSAWLQREALLGAGVVLCAALLSGLAGSLAAPPPGAPNVNAPPLTATSKTPVTITETIDGLQVTLKVAPDQFGLNTFGVQVQDAATGKPIDGANVRLLTNDLDMDMGTETLDLVGVGDGFYRAQGDLLMGGHWQVLVQVLVPKHPNTIHRFTFTFTTSF
jgi:putative copper export protein/methionine-rich copper-binding protein CopC